MYSLLVYATANGAIGSQVLECAARITQRVIPTLGSGIQTFDNWSSTSGIGWFYLIPKPSSRRVLITHHRDARTEVLVYGEMEIDGDESTALTVFRAWRSGGAEAVRRLDGSFSSVIIDYASASVYVIGDVIGRRSLRYFIRDREFLLSTHDLPIVASGRCPLVFDLVSAASIVSWEWSLRGRPLLQPVNRCNPEQYMVWNSGRVRSFDDRSFDLEGRLDPDDKRARKQLIDQMAEAICTRTERLCRDQHEIRLDLTAGFDTRAVLATVLRRVPRDRVTTATAGEPGDIDVYTARQVAGAAGVGHKRLTSAEPNTDSFLDNVDVFAYFMNGDTNSKRALGERICYNPRFPCVLGGTGADFFRAAYYPDLEPGHMDIDQASINLHRLMRKPQYTPWADPDIADAVDDRFKEFLDFCAARTRSGHDVLDFFYLKERFGHFALGARMPHEENCHFPFESLTAILAALRLPSPIGAHCSLHRRLIWRAIPRAYWIPVNGRYWLPVHGRSTPMGDKLGRYIVQRHNSARQKVRANRSIEVIQAESLSTPLGDTVSDLLLAENAIGVQLFGCRVLGRMIDLYRSEGAERDPIELVELMQVLGFLITIERWKAQLEHAVVLARDRMS